MSTVTNAPQTKPYTFTAEKPPLLKEYGFGYISTEYNFSDPSVQLTTNSGTVQIPISSLIQNTPALSLISYNVPCTLNTTYFWRQQNIPQHTGTEEQITVTETKSSSVTQMNSLDISIGAEVGFSAGGFSAKVSTDIKTAKSREETLSSTQSYSKTITLLANTSYANWALINHVILEVNDPKTVYAGVVSALRDKLNELSNQLNGMKRKERKNSPLSIQILEISTAFATLSLLLTQNVSNVELVIATYEDSDPQGNFK